MWTVIYPQWVSTLIEWVPAELYWFWSSSSSSLYHHRGENILPSDIVCWDQSPFWSFSFYQVRVRWAISGWSVFEQSIMWISTVPMNTGAFRAGLSSSPKRNGKAANVFMSFNENWWWFCRRDTCSMGTRTLCQRPFYNRILYHGHFVYADTLSHGHFTTRPLYHTDTLQRGHLRTRTFYHTDAWTQELDSLSHIWFWIIIL